MRRRNPTQPGSRLGMPITAWPAPDQAAWLAAFKPKTPFDARPQGARLRQPTRDAIATCYARWLLWLQTNHSAAFCEPIATRATEARITDYLNDLGGQITPRALANYAARLQSALRILAPHQDWAWLTPSIRQLERLVPTTRIAAWPFIPAGQLLTYGIELMQAAAGNTVLAANRRAEQFRDGLMIAFLATRPLRRKNMLELEIGPHLKAAGEGYKVTLPAEKMKNHVSLEFLMPAELVAFMRDYLAEYRPVLAAGPDGAWARYPEHAGYLWLARSGAPFPSDSFADMITARILSRFDQRLTPHDFRRCAATTIVQNNPEEFLIIQVILGHTTIAMAEKYYIRAKATKAARQHQALVISKRKALAATALPQDRLGRGAQ